MSQMIDSEISWSSPAAKKIIYGGPLTRPLLLTPLGSFLVAKIQPSTRVINEARETRSAEDRRRESNFRRYCTPAGLLNH